LAFFWASKNDAGVMKIPTVYLPVLRDDEKSNVKDKPKSNCKEK
jgi:hypothetical protein